MIARRPLLALPAVLVGAGRGRAQGPLFTLGVASGDPRPDSLVLWTRLAPEPLAPDGGMGVAPTPLSWELAEDDGFRRILRRGEVTAAAVDAHSVHVELSGLPPGRPFFFRFHAAGQVSPTGRTRTAPAPGDPAPVRFMNAACQNWEHGHFTAWAHAARQEDVAFVFHSGDSIYEYAGRDRPGGWGPLVRRHHGGHCRTLADYRIRHAQYRTDADLQAAHAAHPFIASYDDHEVENNWAGDLGGRDRAGQRDDPGGFPARRQAALQAWWEHMPLPREARDRAFRRFRFGRLLDLHVLDTRRFRDEQPCGDGARQACEAVADPRAQMLGPAQEAWLREGIAGGEGWQVLAQQVFMAPRLFEGDRLSMDSWDGVPAARARLLALLAGRDAAVLTGDVHRAWAADLAAAPGGPVVAAEFVATSITSEGDGSPAQAGAAGLVARNPWLRFHSNFRGFTLHEAHPDRLEARFMAVPFVTRPGAPLEQAGHLATLPGKPGLVPG